MNGYEAGPRPAVGLGPAFLVLPWRLEVVRGEALDEVMELGGLALLLVSLHGSEVGQPGAPEDLLAGKHGGVGLDGGASM